MRVRSTMCLLNEKKTRREYSGISAAIPSLRRRNARAITGQSCGDLWVAKSWNDGTDTNAGRKPTTTSEHQTGRRGSLSNFAFF